MFMNRNRVTAGFAGLVAVGTFVAIAADSPGGSNQREVSVVAVDEGNAAFSVERGDVVRLKSSAPAGVQTTAKIKGPAKLSRRANVRTLVDGQPLVGASGAEFEFTTTGKGEVTVTFTMAGGPFGNDTQSEEFVFSVE
jgi:hypothetical protein